MPNSTIPPMSYKCFDTEYAVLPDDQVTRWQSPQMPEGDTLNITGDALSAVINLKTGLVDSVRVNGTEQLQPGSFKPIIFNDIPHSWNCAETWEPANATFRLATSEEATRLLSSESINPGYRNLQKPVQIIEDGPFRSVIEAYFILNHSSVVQCYIINKKERSSNWNWTFSGQRRTRC